MLKKSILLLLISGCLAGCSMNSATGEILPVPNNDTLKDIMPEETYKMMSDIYGEQFIQHVDLFKYAGNEVKDYSFKTIDGKTLTDKDLKGKKIVFEIVANWCEFCKEETKNYMDKIVENNKDIVFVQMFAEGGKSEIDAFYKEVGKQPEVDYVIPSSDEVLEFIQDYGVQSFPTFIFVDETGKLSWMNSGLVTDAQFPTLTKVAFADKKIYDTYDSSTLKIDKLDRNFEDVQNELSPDAIEIIEEVESDDESQQTLYTNLNRSWFENNLTDINGEKVDFGKMKGKNFIFEILTTDEQNFTGSLTSSKNLTKFKNENYEYFQLWLPSEQTTDVVKYLKQNGIEKNADHVFVLDEKNNIPELANIDVYTFPTQFFVDKNFRVAGVTEGAMTKAKFEEATKAFFGKTPLYQMADPDLVK